MDDVMIRKNANVVEALDWRRLFRTDYWGLEMFQDGTWTHKSYRPLAVLTFRWNYWLHGFDSNGFHAVNLALHGLASVLLGFFGAWGMGLPAAWACLLAALFAAHPIHTENVLYIVGRADLLCCAAMLLASLVYAPCVIRRTRCVVSDALRLPLAVVLLVAAGLCKETGFCFFGLLAGWEILRSLTGEGSWPRSVRLVALLAVGGAACYARLWYTSGTSIERMDPFSNPIAGQSDASVRILSYVLVHGLYLKLLVWPVFLCYDYSWDAVPLVHTPADARLLLPLAGYLALAQLTVASLRALQATGSTRGAREGPILGLAVLILSFVPMANVLFPVGTVIGERLLYLPSAGLLACVVSLAFLHSSSVRRRKNAAVSWRQIWAPAALLAIGALFVWRCALRVPDWATAVSITVADGFRQPRSTRVQFNFANERLQAKRYDEALFLYRRAIDLDPQERDSLPFYHAGQVLIYSGRHTEAAAHLEKAVSGYYSPLTIHEEEIWHDYGLSLWFVERPMEAITNMQKALAINPRFTKAWNNMGCAAALGAFSGKLPRAYLQTGLQAIEQCVTIDPENVLYWRNAVGVLLLAGETQAAEGAWARAQALGGGGAVPQDCSWEFYFR